MKITPARVDELDGLRGILAMWVAVSHVLCLNGLASFTPPRHFGRIWTEFIFAQPAVQVFIIMSGFVISFLIHARKNTYFGYMRGRFFRIYPTYLVCLSIGIGTIWLKPFILHSALWHDCLYFHWMADTLQCEDRHFTAHLLSHLTLLNGIIPVKALAGATGTLLTPAWSISLEWQYYILAPLIAILVRSELSLLLLIAISYIGAKYSSYWANPHLAFLPAQLPLFLIGIGSYHIYERLGVKSKEASNNGLLVAAFLGTAVLLSWHTTALVFWGIVFGSLLIDGSGFFARFFLGCRHILLHSWLQRLGSISYPLYLVHWPLLIIWMSLLLHLQPMISSAQSAVLTMLIAMPGILFVSILLHKYVEKPLMKFGKQRNMNFVPIRKINSDIMTVCDKP